MALYCFCKSPDDFLATIRRGANTQGDSDSIACIAGGISGAYLGHPGITPGVGGPSSKNLPIWRGCRPAFLLPAGRHRS